MFPGQIVKTGLTLPKVISGISKTLNVANQIIPLYMQAKPMIQNAKSAFSVAKEFMAPSTPAKSNTNTLSAAKSTNTTSSAPKKEAPKSIATSTNSPVFFV